MKTRSTLFLLTFLFSIFIISSCQKPLDDADIRYLGSWGSDNYALEIWKDGRGVYEKRNKTDELECYVKIEDQMIKFRGGIHKNFDIDAEPYDDGTGQKIMILNGELFYKH
ncbi:MAG: hypothetical protein R2780_14440 [Crocinitomicaceae bacterium]|nr:hypothetical protein [Crocinitomicaceae bacterium]